MAKKVINYNVTDNYFADDYKNVTASEGINTNSLKDLCGQEKIVLGSDGSDCDKGICDDNDQSCYDKPIVLHGDVEITKTDCSDGTLHGNKIVAESFIGDGKKLRNVDDTVITEFEYEKDFRRIVLKQANKNNPEETEQEFSIPTDTFTEDTKVIYFGFEHGSSDKLSLRDNAGNSWEVDLGKYNDAPKETFIEKGSADEYGNIKLSYNQEYMRDINIDISQAILNLEHHITDGYINNKTLVLKVKNSQPIIIPLHELIYDLKYAEDKYIQVVEWCGHELLLKRNDGVEFRVPFYEIINDIIVSNSNNIIGGCVNHNNEIILNFENGNDLLVGKITDNDTYITGHSWIKNPLYPDNPYQMVLRLKQNNDTNIDIRFGEILSLLKNDNTYVIDGEIFKDTIILKNNDGTKVEIPGLINSDTFLINGYYNGIEKELILTNNDKKNKPIKISLDALIKDCKSVSDKHLKNVSWNGDTLVFDVEGHGKLFASFKKYVNVDTSIKNIEYDEGTLTITDLTGKKSSVSGLVKRSDFKNIKSVNVQTLENSNYMVFTFDDNSKLTVKIPDSMVKKGTYSFGKEYNSGKITLDLGNGDTVLIDGIRNTSISEMSINEDTLKVVQNDGKVFLTKLSSIIDINTKNDKLVEGKYINGNLSLKTQSDIDAGTKGLIITGLPKINKKIGATYKPSTSWVGKIDTYGNSDSMFINIDVDDRNGTQSANIIQLPINLSFDVYKVLFGKLNENDTHLTPIPIEISVDGKIKLTEVIPYSIKDSFTLILK